MNSMLIAVQYNANSELADLEMETKPEDVLAEIHRLQAIELSKR